MQNALLASFESCFMLCLYYFSTKVENCIQVAYIF
jgi:hypothetical protein